MNRPFRFLGLTALLGLVSTSCQEYVFEPVVPAMLAVSNRTYELPDTSQADILFVIDDSGSMAGEQENLARNFSAFINAIEQRNAERRAAGKAEVKYRIAVTSTSVGITTSGGISDTYAAGGAACKSAYNIQVGATYPKGAFMAAPGNQTILDSTTLNGAAIIQQFQQNVKIGICGSGQEQGLLAAKLALDHPQQQGFVREGSRLVVAIVSDEEDCSDPDNDLVLQTGEECVAEANKSGGGLLGSVSQYVQFFRSKASDVAVGVIVSVDESTGPDYAPGACLDEQCAQTCDCRDSNGDVDGACLADKRRFPCYCGGQSGGGRYLELARGIGGGSVRDSICQSDFSSTLEDLAELVVGIDHIALDSAPYGDDPSLVLLKIIRPDGTEIVCDSPRAGETCADGVDWEYQNAADGPRIWLCDNPASQCRIQPGDRYRVSFVLEACTENQPCN